MRAGRVERTLQVTVDGSEATDGMTDHSANPIEPWRHVFQTPDNLHPTASGLDGLSACFLRRGTTLYVNTSLACPTS